MMVGRTSCGAWSAPQAGVPILPVIGIVIIAALLTRFESIVSMVGVGGIVLGLVVYRLFRRNRRD